MRYPLTSHTSKMSKIKNKSSVSKGLNYDKDINRTKESLDEAKYKQEINNIENQIEIQEPVKEIQNYINYMNNEAKVYDKETNKYLISALNVDNILNVNNEFKEIEELYHSHKKESLSKNKTPNEAFRLYINFNGHNIKASKVHEISTEIAKRICGNEYKCLISTHTNTNNYHSHILINAYNNDGWHKLKEELKIGLKWQRISNIVALENGCEILMSADDKKNIEEKLQLPKYNYKSKNEKQTSIKNKLGKDILINDINDILKKDHIRSWQDYVFEMKKIGWQFDKNRNNTIVYYKQNFMTKTKNGLMRGYIRETRLGSQYTKKYIEKFLNQKENSIYIIHKIKKINYNKITPKISQDKLFNSRLPLIFRIIKMLINLIKILIDNEYEIIEKNKDQINQIKNNTIELKIKLKQLENIEKKLQEYNFNHPNHIIENDTDLKILKNQTLKKYKQLESQLKNFDKYKNIKSILDSIKIIENNKNIIEKYDLFNLLYQDISDININENLAKLDPMSAKTKSRLYNTIHNSKYNIIKPFNQITETKAKELIYFLSNEKLRGTNSPTSNPIRGTNSPTSDKVVGQSVPQVNSHGTNSPRSESSRGTNSPTSEQSVGQIVPQELCKKIEFYAIKQKEAKIQRSRYNDNLKQEQKKYAKLKVNNKISDKDFDAIMNIKKDIYKLKVFGIKDYDDSQNIKNILNNQLNNLNELNESFKETKQDLKFINELESYFNGNYKDQYKPLSNLINESTLDKMQEYFFKKFNTTTEQILAISKLINNNNQITDIENLTLPTTEQKLCVMLIVKLNGQTITENQINDMSLIDVKNLIENFVKQYNQDQLEKIAKEFFEQDKEKELKEEKQLQKDQEKFNNNVAFETKNIKEQEEIAKKTNFYNLFEL